jgi:hypothetical protein
MELNFRFVPRIAVSDSPTDLIWEYDNQALSTLKLPDSRFG